MKIYIYLGILLLFMLYFCLCAASIYELHCTELLEGCYWKLEQNKQRLKPAPFRST